VRRPIDQAVFGSLLGGAFGAKANERPFPSAGGRYPLELYALVYQVAGLSEGVYHYQPAAHALELLGAPPSAETLPSVFLEQPYLSRVGALIILTAVPSRILYRYGERGYRYLMIEAGHVGQNFALLSAALNLGCLSLGGFFDDDISSSLGLHPEYEVPVYALAVGTPATADRTEVRKLEAAPDGGAPGDR
jgi:SagB-type dehydrogenase family enzyme